MGLTWVNRIGVLTLVLGVAFFFKYAVDNEWIGESGRVALGVTAGLVTMVLADLMWRRQHKVYAQGITAAGIAILYLSFYATFGFYHLLTQGSAFALMALTTVAAGALALRYNSAAISVLALIGGYMTPIVLSTNEDRPWTLFGYILLLNLGALAVARQRRWKVVEYFVLAGTSLIYGGWLAGRFESGKALVATVYLFAFSALPWIMETPFILGSTQVLANLALLVIWWRSSTPCAWLLLALAVVGIVASERRTWSLGCLAAAGFWFSVGLWQSSLDRPANLGEIVLALTAGFVLFFGWIGWRGVALRAVVAELHLVVLLLNSAAYFGICYHLLNPDHHGLMAPLAIAIAAVHLGFALLLWRSREPATRDMRTIQFCIGVAIGFLTLAAPIQFSGYRITMIWALEAAALAWIGARTGTPRLSVASGLTLVLVLARLYAVDAWIYSRPEDYSALVNPRFLTFCVSAVALWMSARWYRPAKVSAAVTYVGGHIVLLLALGMEVLGWAARTASVEEYASMGNVGLSIMMACYGLILIVLGVLTRSAVNRVLGLGLLAVVVVKLYLYDVWLLQRMYRVIAFAGLGLLLLATSFLYSRFRQTIENWWLQSDANP